jgi:hypothetical protein
LGLLCLHNATSVIATPITTSLYQQQQQQQQRKQQ